MAGRPLVATNVGKAPLRARGGVVVEQDVEDYRRPVELIANLVHAVRRQTLSESVWRRVQSDTWS